MTDLETPPLSSHASTRIGHTPFTDRLLRHARASLPPSKRASTIRAYQEMPATYFEAMERELLHTMAASGKRFDECLADLDAFNSLTPETENDAWYDQASAFTSMHLDALQLGFARRRCLKTAAQIAAHATPGQHVLEVGSGSACLAGMLADAMPSWRFTLVDRSVEAIRFSAALQRERGTSDRVRCLQGDIAYLPAGDASADIVIAAEVLEHAPDPEASVGELLRVLRPGGWLAISLPIDLDIAMHPVVFANEAMILSFFGRFPLTRHESEVVAPDPAIDAITDVFPGFAGCLNAVFRKNVD
ncbi:MAG: class I SAM-dependent methyltransferase [Burkholderiaceae bacterium]